MCGRPTGRPIFYSSPRSIIAIKRPIDASLTVWACEHCGHAQSGDIDFTRFYAHEYQFQLSPAAYDDLHAVMDGVPVFRSDLQAQLTMQLVDLPNRAKVIDYGAAKAATTRKICARRSDLLPYVFDVSDDYVPLWDQWTPRAHQATFRIPESWYGSFDVAFSFFVLEHVSQPNELVSEMATLLRDGGVLVCMVPNPLENYSDFIVVDHVSHFTTSSLLLTLQTHGLQIEQYSSQSFSGAHVVIARKQGRALDRTIKPDASRNYVGLKTVGDFWQYAETRLRAVAASHRGPCAIYGAGVYGSYIATRLEDRADLRCFVDRNPHMWGMSEFGIPIVAPADLPSEIHLVFAGLNPVYARAILADVPEWRGRSIERVYLDEKAVVAEREQLTP